MICLSNTNKVQRNLKVAVCLGLAFISNRGRSCYPSSTMHFQTAVTSQNTFGLVSGHVIACLTRAHWLIDVCLVVIHGCYGAQCSKVAASFAIHASHTRARLDCQILSFPATTWCFHTRLARLGGRHPFPFLALPSWPLASSKNWGSWVVLPDPVSPTSTTVWLRLMSFKNSFLRLGCIHIRPKTKVMIYPIFPPSLRIKKVLNQLSQKSGTKPVEKTFKMGVPRPRLSRAVAPGFPSWKFLSLL